MNIPGTRTSRVAVVAIFAAAALFLNACVTTSNQPQNSIANTNTNTNANTTANANFTANANANAATTPNPNLPTITKLDQLQTGQSANFQAPNGKIYIVTAEPQEGENEMENVDTIAAAANPPCDSDKFDGKDRKKAKLSVASPTPEDFDDLADLIASPLPTDEAMGDDHVPAIPTGQTSARGAEEKRNVHIETAWLYTFAREGDEDYHVIIGTTSDRQTADFFNVEISGRPANSAASFQTLKAVRQEFKDFFGLNDACSGGYAAAFKDDPVEIELTGSLFFDKFHYAGNATIGPSWARPTSYWEIHPVTGIVFK
jgi:hypothetical protein